MKATTPSIPKPLKARCMKAASSVNKHLKADASLEKYLEAAVFPFVMKAASSFPS
jgi:hypothetical protein